ncbi:molybdopterin biosynthesis MoaE protein [Chloroherpeton thalassium ATCC 35110]|uniref:Molybdopterin synthase catalytic subunit n=1 Tax=Chloroherpeton thalassium (strain ATCC 35110 / GB-78) TaxID=517418 RepID=B3QZC5_CHLT3|nr:molybdenum cofactor biosynthesis protein MoaE [Chloroherpeton thalassium]ACF13818.1 molybdopterin biosynthesis MoaE protein [Chloroherpeton thalassium ATCC 35110]
MIEIQVTTEKIPPLQNDDSHTADGAELIFHGRVREEEDGKKLSGIFYEHYEEMAENELQKLAEKTVQKFPISGLSCVHRVGFVQNGEASLRVVIWSKHRAESLEAMAWFISELKTHVPIWKKAVLMRD